MSCPMIHQFLHGRNGILHFIKSQSPQCNTNSNRILCSQLFLAKFPIPQTLIHQSQQLPCNSLRMLRVPNANPHRHRPLHRRKTNQVIILNHLQKHKKSLCRSLIHGLADRLTKPLLKSRRQKKLTQTFLKLFVAGAKDSPNHLPVQIGSIVFTVNYIPQSLNHRLIPPVNLSCIQITKIKGKGIFTADVT